MSNAVVAKPATLPVPSSATPTSVSPKQAAVPTPTLTPMPVLTAPVGQAGQWQLRFSADFDGNGLNGEKWVTCYWWDNQGCTIASNHELQWYRRENVTVGDGMARLQARREEIETADGQTFAYTSGMISSGRRVDDVTVSPKFAFNMAMQKCGPKCRRGRAFGAPFGSYRWITSHARRSI